MSMSANRERSTNELEIHPSSFCRFCERNVKCSGTKVPRVSLFSQIKNKDLTGFSGVQSLVLADVALSLGHELRREEGLSDISCLTCARSLARSHASISKLFANLNNGSPKAPGKRTTEARSPTGVTPSSKRANLRDDITHSAGKSRRSLGLENTDSEDQSLGVSPIADKIASEMNLPQNADETIIKVSF